MSTSSGRPSPPRSDGASRRHPASASSVLRPLLTGPRRPLVPRAIFTGAIHLGDPGGSGIEVAVVSPLAVVHPHAVVLAGAGSAWPFDEVHLSSGFTIGDHGIRWSDTTIQVTRWWSPTPALGPTQGDRLAATARTVRRLADRRTSPLTPPEAEALTHLIGALRSGDGPAASSAALDLLGRGGGSTPTGDDLLAGVLAGIDRFATALPPAPEAPMWSAYRQVVAAVLDRCDTATTALSSVLLRHAIQGQVCRPAGRLIVALARGLDEPTLRRSLDDLLAVGSTSGRDLAFGLLAAVDVLVHPNGAARSGARERPDLRDATIAASPSLSTPGRP